MYSSLLWHIASVWLSSTMIMGNAFAAFAMITSAIGIPMLVVAHGANPAAVGAIAMLAGYCGTLMTPMAPTLTSYR